jgi:predicted RNA binding protein YcfA (HicA-like mRNA interferase family)
MERKLIAKGFSKASKRGGHDYFYREDGAYAFVPTHKRRNLSHEVIRNIMKTARLTKEKLEK